MTSRPSATGLRTLANEIDDIGAELVLHYGGMPKNVPPGPPMSLVTRLCKVRDSLREAPSSERAEQRGAYWLIHTDLLKELANGADSDAVWELRRILTLKRPTGNEESK